MDYDRNIHNSPDAQAWAKFFIETTEVMDRAAFRDEGYMIAWFSNAMMAMHDHLYKTEIVKLRNDAANEIERLRNAEMQHTKTIHNLSKMAARLRIGLDQIYELHNSGDEYSEREINDKTYEIVVNALVGYK
jgi:hypothetical protein